MFLQNVFYYSVLKVFSKNVNLPIVILKINLFERGFFLNTKDLTEKFRLK